MDLFEAADRRSHGGDSALIRAFWRFHAENPHVYKLFKRFTFEAICAGYQHFAVSSIIERIRWETAIVTSDPHLKINNNHRAYYARLFMRDHPEHAGFFRTRAVEGELEVAA